MSWRVRSTNKKPREADSQTRCCKFSITPQFSCVILAVRLLLLSCRSRSHTYCDNSRIPTLPLEPIYAMLAAACFHQRTNCCRPHRPLNGSAWARTSSGDGRRWQSERVRPASANAATSPGMTTWRPRLSGVNTHGHRKGPAGPPKTSHRGSQESPTYADRNHPTDPRRNS